MTSIDAVLPEPDQSRADPRLRRARMVTLLALAVNLMTSLLMPLVGLVREPRQLWLVLGATGVLVFTATHVGVLYTLVTPWLAEPARRALLLAFAGATLLSVPLVGPVAAGVWPTWAWLGATVIGVVPLLSRWPVAVATTVLTFAASVGVARWTGGSATGHLLVTGAFGLGTAVINWLQVWFWDLLVQARQGRTAQAQLAAAEERLRFARDVHDLLGHNLTVIALKAELAARLAPVDAVRAGLEAAEAQRLAVSALHDVREAVHGYRRVDLPAHLAAIAQVLRSSGVRCTVTAPDAELPAPVAAQLAPILREASSNVLRHSRAQWCTIDIDQEPDGIRLTVTNDGVTDAGPDRYSHGLRGLADRLGETGGTLRTGSADGVFTLRAVVKLEP
ncbi:sensor histidine kinase [Micromonospora sp. NPDC050397]|uniref:sensor histidine kinase n=1 Tax=Micromonospora sp. NPDC050397 TaxID=3364279 RepID=UPI00384C34A4